MAKGNPKQNRAERGTHDDLEILKQIVCENRALFHKVLDKIRSLREAQDQTVLDVAAKKYDAKLNTYRNPNRKT